VRTFYLLREGLGVVAEGVEFSNGKAALCWQTEPGSVAVFDSLGELEAIHGHGGKSQIVESRNADHSGHHQN
jgi:hypothetical protein